MNYNEFKKWFEYIEKFDEESTAANAALYKLGGGLLEVGFNLYDGYIELLSKMIGDNDKWIAYYVFDCNLGNDPKEVKFKGKKVIILDSLKKLYNIIQARKKC